MTMHCAAASEEIEPLRKAAGRHCGACTLCCYILGVDADNLTKPPDTKCRHCVASEGCAIYDSRPAPCRGFSCQWLIDQSLDDLWFPLTARIVISLVCDDDGSNPYFIFEVDPRCPNRWLQAPYFQRISNIAAAVRTNGIGAMVRCGRHWYALGDFEWVEVAMPPDFAETGWRLGH